MAFNRLWEKNSVMERIKLMEQIRRILFKVCVRISPRDAFIWSE